MFVARRRHVGLAALPGSRDAACSLLFVRTDAGWYVSQERSPVLWIGQVAVVTLPAEIDVTMANTVQEELLTVLNAGAALLVADMRKTTFCDSAGVSALVRAFRRASASGSAMRLVIGTPAVQRVISITGVDRLIETFPSIAAALTGPYGPPGERDERDQAQPDAAAAGADADG
jgi:anti-sigma B factor antagonist